MFKGFGRSTGIAQVGCAPTQAVEGPLTQIRLLAGLEQLFQAFRRRVKGLGLVFQFGELESGGFGQFVIGVLTQQKGVNLDGGLVLLKGFLCPGRIVEGSTVERGVLVLLDYPVQVFDRLRPLLGLDQGGPKLDEDPVGTGALGILGQVGFKGDLGGRELIGGQRIHALLQPGVLGKGMLRELVGHPAEVFGGQCLVAGFSFDPAQVVFRGGTKGTVGMFLDDLLKAGAAFGILLSIVSYPPGFHQGLGGLGTGEGYLGKEFDGMTFIAGFFAGQSRGEECEIHIDGLGLFFCEGLQPFRGLLPVFQLVGACAGEVFKLCQGFLLNLLGDQWGKKDQARFPIFLLVGDLPGTKACDVFVGTLGILSNVALKGL